MKKATLFTMPGKYVHVTKLVSNPTTIVKVNPHAERYQKDIEYISTTAGTVPAAVVLL